MATFLRLAASFFIAGICTRRIKREHESQAVVHASDFFPGQLLSGSRSATTLGVTAVMSRNAPARVGLGPQISVHGGVGRRALPVSMQEPAYLPNLPQGWKSTDGDPPDVAEVAAAAAAPLSVQAIKETLAPHMDGLRQLDVRVWVERVSADKGEVVLNYEGPPGSKRKQRELEEQLKADYSTIRSVVFLRPNAADVLDAAAPLSVQAINATLAPLLDSLRGLGVRVKAECVSADKGKVVLNYEGPPRTQREFEKTLRADYATISSVVFLGPEVAAAAADAAPLTVDAEFPTVQAIKKTLAPLLDDLGELGVLVSVKRVLAEKGEVVLTYSGPPQSQQGLEKQLRAQYSTIRRVSFLRPEGIPVSAPQPQPIPAAVTAPSVPGVAADVADAAAPLTVQAIDKTLAPLLDGLGKLGVLVLVDHVSADTGEVVLTYEGPELSRQKLEERMRADNSAIRSVTFLGPDGKETLAPQPRPTSATATVESDVVDAPASLLSVQAINETLQPLLGGLGPLGVRVSIANEGSWSGGLGPVGPVGLGRWADGWSWSADEGKVVLNYEGPPGPKRGSEKLVRADYDTISSVEFLRPIVATDAADAAATLTVQAIEETLEGLLDGLGELDVLVSVESVSADEGEVVLTYEGPPGPQRALESLLRADFSTISSVTFLRPDGTPASAPQPQRTPTSASVPSIPTRFASPGVRFKPRQLKNDERGDQFATLHARGWVVLSSRIAPLEPSLLDAVMQSPFTPIFNGQDVGEQPLRFMGMSSKWSAEVEGLFTSALSAAGLLACSDSSSVKTVRDCYALRSLPCDEDETRAEELGRQPLHSDAPAVVEGATPLSALADEDMPLSVLLAVMPGTKLWVFPNGCKDTSAGFVVRLEVGEMMVWRGDLVHAGAGYSTPHMRIHAYVDPPSKFFDRPTGKTNLCPRS